MGSATLYSVLIYILLSEDVTYASNVFETYVIVTILKLCCFNYHICKLGNILLFVNSIVILFHCNSMYVICICLIYGDLGCDVDLPRSFVTLGGLPGLYK